jgi:uncharacterized metal-binding protein
MAKAKECSCSGGAKLIFSCSGAADVGAIADQAARKLTREGAGKMFCLTGIGGQVDTIMKFAKAAEKIVAINGCALNCTTHCLKKAGFTDFAEIQLGELGMEKGMSPANDENIDKAAEATRKLLTC